jgi:hypothetical protein
MAVNLLPMLTPLVILAIELSLLSKKTMSIFTHSLDKMKIGRLQVRWKHLADRGAPTRRRNKLL